MGTPSTIRSACWKRTANSWILSQTAVSAGSIGSLFTPLYFAPMASWSKSGSFSSHTFSLSTVSSGQAWRYACRNASATAMEVDLGPRGEDWMLSRCIGCPWVKGVSCGGLRYGVTSQGTNGAKGVEMGLEAYCPALAVLLGWVGNRADQGPQAGGVARKLSRW